MEKNKMTGERMNNISWDEYFMGVAMLSAMRSKDPSTQVGSCIVTEDKRIVGIGYNGAPKGFDDKDFPWARKGDFLKVKYPFVVHAEANAIMNATTNLKGCILYVALMPCNQCAQLIAQSGIKEVVYISDKYKDVDVFKAGKIILNKAGIKIRKFKSENKTLMIDFDKVNK